MITLPEFRQDVLNQARARASVDGVFTADAFVSEAADLLISSDEIDSIDLLSFRGTGRRRQSLAVYGYQVDENDRSVALLMAHYNGATSPATLSYSDATNSLKALENYLKEALSGEFLIDREPSTPEYQLAQMLMELHSAKGNRPVSRFRLYLVTDASLSARAKSLDSTEILGTPAEFHIWDMQRFFQVHLSSQGREPLELDLEKLANGGVPALRVADGAGDVTTYLAAVPGKLLASLYRDHGSRLLEGNVRSFLTTKGKINKGIRETILREPTHFLAYNNGISATASGVTYDRGAITKITDLQIVNGGQTTASLFYAAKSNAVPDWEDVFVQMKLVVVSPDDAREMVPLISRYANSQNAVREDDFFSNNPFHVRMEELSKTVLAPAMPGVNFQTKWYYERTRGQYLNENNRRTASEQRTFAAEFPRAQLITKTDAAKYVVAWEQQPHQVSAGAQKNFKAFAALVAQKYLDQPEAFGPDYYRRLVGKAILFDTVRSAISKADWYQPGYLANLAAYSVSKLSLEISRDPRAETFDLIRIWQAQAVGEATVFEAVTIARLALDVLTGPERLVVNVTEWAKRESAWRQLAAVKHKLSDDFIAECIPVKLNSLGEPAVTVNGRFPSDQSDRDNVRSISDASWKSIRAFLSEKSILTAPEKRLATNLISGPNRMLDAEEARDLLRLYVKALNEGWNEQTDRSPQ